jgi:hypothetical protein
VCRSFQQEETPRVAIKHWIFTIAASDSSRVCRHSAEQLGHTYFVQSLNLTWTLLILGRLCQPSVSVTHICDSSKAGLRLIAFDVHPLSRETVKE